MRRLVLAFGLLLGAFPTPSRAASVATCPTNTVGSGGSIVYYSSSAPTGSYSNTIGTGSWNLPAGVADMYSAGSLGGLSLNVYDDFDATGVPPGTPVALVAELTVDGAVWTDGCGGTGCGGLYTVRIYHGNDSLEVSHTAFMFTGRFDYHDVIALPLTIVAGQAERIRIWAEGRRTPGGSHQSEANCVLRFTGADQSVTVTSCNGFQSVPTPTLRRSWGAVKQLYR